MQNQQIKSSRIPFIQALVDAGCTDVVTRAELDEICESTGMFVWPPAWIVKDKSRRAGRGRSKKGETRETFKIHHTNIEKACAGTHTRNQLVAMVQAS